MRRALKTIRFLFVRVKRSKEQGRGRSEACTCTSHVYVSWFLTYSKPHDWNRLCDCISLWRMCFLYIRTLFHSLFRSRVHWSMKSSNIKYNGWLETCSSWKSKITLWHLQLWKGVEAVAGIRLEWTPSLGHFISSSTVTCPRPEQLKFKTQVTFRTHRVSKWPP